MENNATLRKAVALNDYCITLIIQLLYDIRGSMYGAWRDVYGDIIFGVGLEDTVVLVRSRYIKLVSREGG